MFSKAVEDKSLLKEKKEPATVETASKAVKDFGKKVADQKAKNDKKPATAKSKGIVSSEGRNGRPHSPGRSSGSQGMKLKLAAVPYGGNMPITQRAKKG